MIVQPLKSSFSSWRYTAIKLAAIHSFLEYFEVPSSEKPFISSVVGGKYTLELAKEFSAYQSEKLGDTCSDWQIKPYCYGDIGYVDKVMKNYSGGEMVDGGYKDLKTKLFVQPMKNTKSFLKLQIPLTWIY